MTPVEDPISDDNDDGAEKHESPGAATERTDAGRRSARMIAAVLVVIVVIAVAIGVWLLKWPPKTPQEQRSADRQDALISAEHFAKTMTGFEAGKRDQYVDAVTELLSDGRDSPCWSTVAALVPAVGDEATAKAAKQRKQTYDGSVSDRAIEAIDSDTARALLVADYSMEATIKKKRVPLAAQRLRMRFELTKDDGDWLIDECNVVGPEAGDGK
ncbi:MAG TPA: hypothetical protein VK059_05445 [Nocardioidaceae bacterium]|nr:hypothetical protein [Nocardioidaceae bacterium]